MIGKREISALEMVGCTYFNSSYHPTSLIRDYRNSSWVVVLCSAFLAATLTYPQREYGPGAESQTSI